ncbi:MAG: molybdopterin-dependent oxidoreductase, partial [Cutibacterium granulosum]|uniref:molybdopterin-dependent oxidoreductase n=1 Tax=Cutibacterium granulosum TaxID=33011 RepID=UPI002B223167
MTTSRTASQHPEKRQSGTSRRTFLKWSGAVGGAAALVPAIASTGSADAESPSRLVWNACLANCQSRCPLRLEVKDGAVVRVLPDSTGSDEFGDFNIRACVRGRNQRERIYSPDRIKHPMRRIGARGAGQWKQISWDEALDEIAAKMKQIKAKYGNEAIWYHYGTGSTGGNITKRGSWTRLIDLYGGHLGFYGDYSAAQLEAATPYHYGRFLGSNSFQDARHSKLQVMFGNNPLETRMSGGGELAVTQKTRKEYNIRTIVIDPRYSETAVTLADEWIPIRPGTDAALIAGLIHTMITENLHDQ